MVAGVGRVLILPTDSWIPMRFSSCDTSAVIAVSADSPPAAVRSGEKQGGARYRADNGGCIKCMTGDRSESAVLREGCETLHGCVSGRPSCTTRL